MTKQQQQRNPNIFKFVVILMVVVVIAVILSWITISFTDLQLLLFFRKPNDSSTHRRGDRGILLLLRQRDDEGSEGQQQQQLEQEQKEIDKQLLYYNVTTNNENMNGEYVLSNTPNAPNDTQRLFPTNYKDYPDKDIVPIEYFDVYSPIISQLYSQVYWKGLPPVNLPEHIMSKYKDKVMAVVGFELDQIRVVMDEETGQEKEMSIPMNALYNHHFESTMIGGDTKHFELVSPNDERLIHVTSKNMGHGIPPNQPYWLVVEDDNNKSTGGRQDATSNTTIYPTMQAFGGGNGGEVRKSFHGYSPGYAQLIYSPKQLQITPMQIDTWNRDEMDLLFSNPTTNFVAGPLPRNSLAPLINATYSGLLECPVTTRITKHVPPQGYYPLSSHGTCSDSNNSAHDGMIENSDECFNAVHEIVRETDQITPIRNVTGNDDNLPRGCTVRMIVQEQEETTTSYYRVIEAYYNDLQIGRTNDCGSHNSNIFSTMTTSLVQIQVDIDVAKDLVTIELVGPADVWFGVGFGAAKMNDMPWTIIVEGGDEDGNITEYKLSNHAEGTKLVTPSIHIISQNIDETNNMKTVILTRPMKGKYFNFETEGVTEIQFINAIGSSKVFSYHKSKEASSMLLLPVANTSDDDDSSGICICQKSPPPFGMANGGTLEYHPVEGQAGEMGLPGKVHLSNKCEPFPREVLLEERNPTCDIRSYAGGQSACHHMWSLLDADQEIPWVDQPLEYRLKFRFWVQPFNETYHTNVHRTTWGIGSPTEYDVPKCDEGIPNCSQEVDSVTQEKRWVHTIRGTFHAGNTGKLVAAHFHCHAPTCLTTELFLCDDNAKECDETTGTLLCQETTVRGHGERGQRFNEPGFIYQPPCLWGFSDVGLEAPVDVKGRTLFAKKTADATYGHHGEMAWLQMYFVPS